MIFQRREQLRSFDRKVQDRVDFGGKMDLKETGKAGLAQVAEQ